ncbi:glycoside hydrolase family 13 protein [Robertmurraya yapensis]|uniref:Glycoside hydrolase family 13 protein n=1 Tax=Bacillus yapensis TaxID=2492960 RepID=A0A431W069_9BACI|nr:glycoside hydrolase family 13 protein [Bacillus yapensis]RTR28805.1 glycoside hydrolase family 13 protein [Bacillus yapensis]TKS94663.1 glycoside hydrolase family 13 protein [Bacillus yapensis]
MENRICSRFEGGNFRYPSGAVPTHSTLIFEIEVPRFYGVKEVSLVLINDRDHQYHRLRMGWKGIDNGRDLYELGIELGEAGLNWYYFQLDSLTEVKYVGINEGDSIISEHEPSSWQLTVYDEKFTTPDWIKGGIFYHIFVDRFARIGKTVVKDDIVFRDDWGGLPTYKPNEEGEVLNNDFFGGNLKGIIGKLDYIHSLGVTCIYLSPIFEAYSNHKYDTGDFTKIDPMFGTLSDFRKLCKEAKRRGIRVIMDGVFNHVGSDSVYFNKNGTYQEIGAYQSKASPYYSWFKFIDYPDKYESWWGIQTLPSVNEEEPTYVEFITGENGITKKWLEEGASGWRLDVVDELPDPFIEKIRQAIKSSQPESLLIGEVWEDASNKIAYGHRKKYLLGKQLDSVMNYPFMNGIIEFVRNGNAEQLDSVVTSILQNYPSSVVHCLMNMLGTHDTQRILTALGGKDLSHAPKEEQADTCMTKKERQDAIQLLKMASLLQMTLPGVPCIYYGDEAGMEGYNDPFNRRCYPWGQEESELVKWYQRLGAIRKKWSVFKDGEYKTIYGKEGIFLFQRTDGKEKIVVGVNRSEEPFRFEVENEYVDLFGVDTVIDQYILEPNKVCFLGIR